MLHLRKMNAPFDWVGGVRLTKLVCLTSFTPRLWVRPRPPVSQERNEDSHAATKSNYRALLVLSHRGVWPRAACSLVRGWWLVGRSGSSSPAAKVDS